MPGTTSIVSVFARFAFIATLAVGFYLHPPIVCADDPFVELGQQYGQHVRPLMTQLCLDCHSTEEREGELDLERFGTLSSVRRDPHAWIKVRAMLANGEMPPKDETQPKPDEKQRLIQWVGAYLDAEALASAGDPGPVVLRRLSNAEYTYTVRDLTGVPLDPAREFPTDGAAGEGFTNTGSALVMSPVLLQKYLDAGKEIAAHAVLLPDGFQFTPSVHRPDWADEILAEIRSLYLRNTGGKGIDFSYTKQVGDTAPAGPSEGRVDLVKYTTALIKHRKSLLKDPGAAVAVAREEQLNARYLQILAERLVSETPKSMLLDVIRKRWRSASVQQAPALAAEIRAWQDRLWKFNQVAHFAVIRPWQEPVTNLPNFVTLKQKFPDKGYESDVTLYLVAGAAGDGISRDKILWQRPRIEFKSRPPITLRDARALSVLASTVWKNELAQSSKYLAAVAEIVQTKAPADEVAARHKLNGDLLAQWRAYLSVGNELPAKIGDYLKTKAASVKAGSILDRWRAAAADPARHGELLELAEKVQRLLVGKAPEADDQSPDAQLYRELTAIRNPLIANMDAECFLKANQRDGKPADGSGRFGKGPDGMNAPTDLLTSAPEVIEFQLPLDLVRGGEFIVDATLHPELGAEGTVQPQILTNPPADASQLAPGVPIVTRPDSEGRRRILTAFDDFRSLFPAAMCYSRVVPIDGVVTLVLYHREDEHLCRLMIDDKEKARLDRLWDELLYVSHAPLTMVTAFEQISEFATQDRPDLVIKLKPLAKTINERAEALRKKLVETEPAQLDALVEFAARVYRRPLTDRESQGLRKLYQQLRQGDVAHDDAFRLTLARLFASPAFLYRADRPGKGAAPTPVSDWELATRLSYFLWSSMPDDELRQAAASGKLSDPKVLAAQTERMLHDRRVRRMAIEFACQWLHIRDFDQLEEKSERHFPTFIDLRDEMYEESIQFFTDLFRNDRSILSILDADHTFLNEALAEHYGIPGVQGGQWRRVDGMRKHARGGVLAHATTLAKQSGASRTSPILRGNWVYETLLGERLPRPPKGVPQLPDTVPEGLTERQLIEKHSSVEVCAKCHARIDPFGFALENFDAIGRLRRQDDGRPIDARTALPDGSKIEGLDGLRDYLSTKRKKDFLRNFCRKLLGYALGRAVQLSDKPLIDELMVELQDSDYRFSIAVQEIVASKQFRCVRGIGAAQEATQ